MKISFTPTPEDKWHSWFAWRPVLTRLRNGRRSLVWLSTVERYRCCHETEYRLLGEK